MIKITKKYILEMELDSDNLEKLSDDLHKLIHDEPDVNSVTRDLADVIKASLYV